MGESSEPFVVRFSRAGRAVVLHAEHDGGKNSWESLQALSRELNSYVAAEQTSPRIVFLEFDGYIPTVAAVGPDVAGPDGQPCGPAPRLLILLSPAALTTGKPVGSAEEAERKMAESALEHLLAKLGDKSADQLLILSPGTEQAQVRELRTRQDQVIGHEIICPRRGFRAPPPPWPVALARILLSGVGSQAPRNFSPNTPPAHLLKGALRSKCLSQYKNGATVQLSAAASDRPLRLPVLHVYFDFPDSRRKKDLRPWILPPAAAPARNGALLQRIARQDGAEDIMDRCLHATGPELVQAVIDSEADHIKARRVDREARIRDTPTRTVAGLTGLALSGGGIRSATVSLGFMRGLQDVRALEMFDYASSVSGGSYANGYLQVMTSPPVLAQLGVKPKSGNPFTRALDDQSLGALLASGRYLAMGTGPRGFFNVLRFFTNYVTALLQHWLWIVSVLITLGLALRFATHWLRPLAGGFAGLAAMFLFFRLSLLRDYKKGRRSLRVLDDWTNRAEAFAWYLLAGSAVALLVERIPSWVASLARHVGATASALPCTATWGTGVLTAALVAAHYGFDRSVDQRTDWWRSLIAFFAGSLAVTLGAWQLASVCKYVSDHHGEHAVSTWLQAVNTSHCLRLVVMLVVTLILTFITSPNNTSLYRYYSARLSDAFLKGVKRFAPSDEEESSGGKPTRGAALSSLLRSASLGERPVLLSDLGTRGNLGPYPLFNGCVNLMGADDTKFVGLRTSDYFVMAPHHCGAKLTGYALTKEFKQYDHLTLAAAVTVSGAAISPFQGRTMPSAVSIALWLLNLRTDVWLPNPSHPRKGCWRRALGDAAVIWGPVQQLAALFGQLTTRSRFLNVADGAFIDNLGLYELLRRRCRMIVVLDATLDPEYDFHELRNVVLRARQELGIEFSFDEAPEDAIKPKSADGGSDKGVVTAMIDYPECEDSAGKMHGKDRGVLFYVKSALSKVTLDEGPTELTGQNAAEVSRAYRTYYPEFPQESTGDQVFDAVQWRAYYALGRALAAELIAHPSWTPGRPRKAPQV